MTITLLKKRLKTKIMEQFKNIPEFVNRTEAISQNQPPIVRTYSIDLIQRIVCQVLDVKKEVLYKRTRKREIVQARQIIWYFVAKYLYISSTTGGKRYGYDHTTYLHGVKTICNLYECNSTIRNFVNKIENLLNQSNSARCYPDKNGQLVISTVDPGNVNYNFKACKQ